MRFCTGVSFSQGSTYEFNFSNSETFIVRSNFYSYGVSGVSAATVSQAAVKITCMLYKGSNFISCINFKQPDSAYLSLTKLLFITRGYLYVK